jgi:tRNA A-37 threonylcarbamoyl transferase component Bud32
MKPTNSFSLNYGYSIHELFSRRNNVFFIKSESFSLDSCIIKFYSGSNPELKSYTEYENLRKLNNQGIKVPQIRSSHSGYNVMEYIPGLLVSDLAYSFNMGPWIEKLAYWMFQIHSIHKNSHENINNSFLKGDCNLRNFIYYQNEIYGLDFEENRYGDPREDLSEICYFILDNQVNNPEKIFMAQRFLKSYEKFSEQKINNLSYFLRKSSLSAEKRKKKWRKSR